MEPVAEIVGHCFVVGDTRHHQLRASMSAGWRGSAGQVRRNCRIRRQFRIFFPGKNSDLGAGSGGSSNGPGGEHGSPPATTRPVPGRQSHRRAGLKAGQQRAGARNCAPGHGGGPGHHGRAGGAHGSSIAALQSSLTTGLSNKADQWAFDVLESVVATKSTPDGVDPKLSNYSTTAAMNGSIALANNATLATVAANYGFKTVVDHCT